MILLEIDNREPNLIKNHFEKLRSNLNVTFKNLDQGDFIIKDSNDNILLIIERKTLEDLLASVKDNRYAEQHERYSLINIESRYIYYIIEGNINKYSNNTSEYKTIYSCLFSLSYKKGFMVYNTNSIDDTIIFLEEFIQRFSNIKIDNNNKINLLKKNVITKYNINNYMLNLIPGIGYNTAMEILNNFNNSVYELIVKLKENINLLDNIKIKNRKISSKIINNIKHFLL